MYLKKHLIFLAETKQPAYLFKRPRFNNPLTRFYKPELHDRISGFKRDYFNAVFDLVLGSPECHFHEMHIDSLVVVNDTRWEVQKGYLELHYPADEIRLSQSFPVARFLNREAQQDFYVKEDFWTRRNRLDIVRLYLSTHHAH